MWSETFPAVERSTVGAGCASLRSVGCASKSTRTLENILIVADALTIVIASRHDDARIAEIRDPATGRAAAVRISTSSRNGNTGLSAVQCWRHSAIPDGLCGS